MVKRRLILGSGLLILLASALLYAAKGTPLVATFFPNMSSNGTGISDDGNSTYQNGIGGVQCYFGVNGGNLDLVTYNTPRTLHFVFDKSSPAWQQSGLPADFYATVDFYGTNYFGQYASMAVGTTAQVHGSLEFYVGALTYELNFQSLAAYRTFSSTWLITSDAADIPGNPGFTASPQAALSVIRRHSQTIYGAVNMPIRFQVNTL